MFTAILFTIAKKTGKKSLISNGETKINTFVQWNTTQQYKGANYCNTKQHG